MRSCALAFCGVILTLGSVEADDITATIRSRFQRVELAHLPTPLEELKTLTKELGGPRIYIKRDDQTGLAFGGNKARKLEYIFADILAKRADSVITSAGVQSNWCRQTAAAACIHGVKPILVLFKREAGSAPVEGNLLLDYIMGADVRLIEPGHDRASIIDRIVNEEKAKGLRPYVVPTGGSRVGGDMTRPLGAIAYAAAFDEIYRQAREKKFKVDHVVLATGSGGTQAGLVVGAKAVDPDVQIVGISISGGKPTVQENVAEIANRTAEALGLGLDFKPDDIIVFDEYVGEGYGKLSQSHADAIALTAGKEGILLDPVYTGKAMAGMLDLVKKGYFKKDEGVVFLHTGGTPALFVYGERLMELTGRQ